MTVRRVVTSGALAAGAMTAVPAGADAVTLTVTTLADNSGAPPPGSLRQRIMQANSTPAPDDITFSSSLTGTIEMDGSAFTISEPLRILGPGRNRLRIDANSQSRHFTLGTDPGDDVTISGLRLVEGRSVSFSGGSIRNHADADLTVLDSVISGSETTAFGGGIYTYGTGTLTVRRSALAGNESDLGGAIYSRAPKTVIVDSRISGNSSIGAGPEGNGGGISHFGGPLTISGSSVTRNEAARNGGGVLSLVDMRIRNSVIAQNTADYGGGGVSVTGPYADGAQVTIAGSTISGNRAYLIGGMLANGTTTIRSSTISRNVSSGANGYAGGIDTNDGTTTIMNTIVAGNSATKAPDVQSPGLNGGILRARSSIVGNRAGQTITNLGGNRFGVNPRLGPLANNGGPTLTHALRPGSPAINRGSKAKKGANACTPTDQRGVPRKLGGRCDIGAYERVRCGGVLVNRVGTNAVDILKGTKKRDGILGRGGNDRLLGLRGNDGLCGGPGIDRLFGGPGVDRLLGQAGFDRLYGGPHGDFLFGGARRDRLFGQAGNDLLIGGPGRDVLRGGPGRDRLRQ